MLEDDHGLDVEGGQRLDRWLWFARLLKSRTLASSAVSDGRIRVNRVRVTKPAYTIKPGDVLTIALRGKVSVVKVLNLGVRRGPPVEAHNLYEDISATPPRVDKLTDERK